MNATTLPALARLGPVHFMGIGGAGMCALAELLHRQGMEVTGCDLRPGPSVGTLRSAGVEVTAGHGPHHVERAAALVVSAAVPADHPEIQRARDLEIPVMKRARALAEWVSQGQVVGVAGTHGKTTTTAMTTEILATAGVDPTGLVGGAVRRWGGNLRFGGTSLFVVEADEYDRSFLALSPLVAIVTNVEADHLDTYGSLEEVRAAFRSFVQSVNGEGRVAVCADDHGASRLVPELGQRGYTFGLSPGSQLRGVRLRLEGAGSRFEVEEEGHSRGGIHLRVPGRHNVLNALGAAAAARFLGVGWGDVREALGRFEGVARRFQFLGEAQGIVVVDDYAHHPTEVEATLVAARQAHAGRRIVAVFQPHLYSRTRDFASEFGRALALADVVWVTDVYPAREPPIAGVSGEMVASAVLEAGGVEVRYHAALADLPDAVVGELRAGDLCLTLGAGSVENTGPAILRALDRGNHA